ncbi:hypothetical protein [Bacillus atrophaeus]|nr:hypothetical protein [Bacillus atrophaeus]
MHKPNQSLKRGLPDARYQRLQANKSQIIYHDLAFLQETFS